MKSETDTLLDGLAVDLGAALKAHRLLAATAESCTGGWVAQAITAIAGSSDWFERGFVTYSDEAKQELLGVPAATLATHGAVSAETAAAMARGALTRSHASLAVSITGIAGPGGGSREKPIGTVWFGFALRAGDVITRHRLFTGDRYSVRAQAVAYALQGLLALASTGRE